jgi:hypothetical protein
MMPSKNGDEVWVAVVSQDYEGLDLIGVYAEADHGKEVLTQMMQRAKPPKWLLSEEDDTWFFRARGHYTTYEVRKYKIGEPSEWV